MHHISCVLNAVRPLLAIRNVFKGSIHYVSGNSRYETCGMGKKWRADKNPKMLQ
jgi:hypothetical protein